MRSARGVLFLLLPTACSPAGVDPCVVPGVCADAGSPSVGVDLARGAGVAMDGAVGPPTGTVDLAAYTPSPLVAARPYAAYVPAGLDPGAPAPLILALHGYISSGSGILDYFGLRALADAHGILLAAPDGKKDNLGNRYWNADDACCDVFAQHPDDSAYLGAVLDDMAARYRVDPKRVYVVGHSNGAFMSHRMACDHADRIAAIFAMSGDAWKDPARCNPVEHVAVAQLHGDANLVIYYGGGQNFPLAPYPAAVDSIAGWATRNGCPSHDDSQPAIDVSADQPGTETQRRVYGGCAGGAAELWTMHGAPHEPHLAGTYAETVWGFLSAHSKP